jgi:hypothetical protein
VSFNVDELRTLPLSGLASVALSFAPSQSHWFWFVTGMITAKLPSNHPSAMKLWDCAHSCNLHDGSTLANLYEARRICQDLLEREESHG